MMSNWIVRFAPWILGLITLGFILTLWRTLKAFHVARTGHYYAVRQEARVLGLRWSAIAASILIAGIVVGLYVQALHQRVPLTSNKPSTVLSATPITPPPVPSPTIELSFTPIPLSTSFPPTIVPTHSLLRTFLPADVLPTVLTPPPSAIAAAPEARFGTITFIPSSKGAKCPLDFTGQSVTDFVVGTSKICAVFEVRNMTRNAPWTAAWFKEDKYVDGSTMLWDGPTNGAGVAFYTAPGHEPGHWSLQLYIEGRLQSIGVFTVSLSVTPTPVISLTPTRARRTSQLIAGEALPMPAVTPTLTLAPALTPTFTPTPTLTLTFTPTSTLTPTFTLMLTPTPTPTFTPTLTLTPTLASSQVTESP